MAIPNDTTCPSCGHENARGANFCSSCGVRIGTIRDEKTDALAVEDLVQAEDQGDDHGFDRSGFGPDMGMLFVGTGSKAGSRYALDTELVTAGRHPDSIIFLDDVTVSRRHAEVSNVAGEYIVRDVGSLNGTYVNRERVEEATLHDGDELQVGKFKLVFYRGVAS